jgi:hypothetical protein
MVVDLDLGVRRWQARGGEHEAGSGLLRRFRAPVGKGDRSAQLHDSAGAGVPVDEDVDGALLEPGGLHQRIQVDHRVGQTRTPADVEGRPCRGRRRHATDTAAFIVGQLVAVQHDAPRRVATAVEQLGG